MMWLRTLPLVERIVLAISDAVDVIAMPPGPAGVLCDEVVALIAEGGRPASALSFDDCTRPFGIEAFARMAGTLGEVGAAPRLRPCEIRLFIGDNIDSLNWARLQLLLASIGAPPAWRVAAMFTRWSPSESLSSWLHM
mmetsp:Transcript_27698/g.80288  ORF Transcript_27698/g.80288 Transcript_27698/m.80288 type:complete len:138 (+) Transcript_27698:407-820(+)